MAELLPGTAPDIEPEFSIPEDSLTLLADDALLGLVRSGSSDAYAVLFERYRHPAHRLATYFSNPVDAKDIVAETFADVLHQLHRGQGPHTYFRSYLFTSVRREAGKRARLRKRVNVTDNMTTLDKPVSFGGGGADTFERELVRAAFATLPLRWRTVLWHLDVDGRKPNELASSLGLTPNAVSALAYRAREGLRKAYLEQHVLTNGKSRSALCQDVHRRLVVFVRGSATARDVSVIDPHLEVCAPCVDVYLELEEVNTHLGAVSSLVAIGFAAPASGLVGGLFANATVAAKSMFAAVGSTAAAIVTSVSIATIPTIPPASAMIVQALPHRQIQHEPGRTQGPAADGEPWSGTQNDPAEFSGAQTPISGGTTPYPAPSSSFTPSLPVGVGTKGSTATVDVRGANVNASANAGGANVDASANVGGANVNASANVGGGNVNASAGVGSTTVKVSVDLKVPTKTSVKTNEIQIEAADAKKLGDTVRDVLETE